MIQFIVRKYQRSINLYYSKIKKKVEGKNPDFIILGTQKGGTTSLYNYLSNHSKICVGSRREIHFFDRNYEKGTYWYKNNFNNENKALLTFECSPDYIHHPFVAERIKLLSPKLKLIVLLRNPVERAISNYKHNIYLGKYRPNTTIEEVIESEMKFINHEKEKMMKNKNYYSRKFKYFSILDRGIYHKQLKIYFDNFDKKQIHILFSEKLFLNTRKELNKLFKFLNLNPEKVPCSTIYNKSKIDMKIKEKTKETIENFFLEHNEKLYKMINTKFRWQAY